MARLAEIVLYLDRRLETQDTPDYPQALNGLQMENGGRVTRLAAAVDASLRTIEGTAAAKADLLLVHHGLFWGGLQPMVGPRLARVRALLDHGIAVYSSHLPLDRHAELGNNALLASALGLVPTDPFARFESISIGVRGTSDIDTGELFGRASAFARQHGGEARVTAMAAGRRTRSWGICTGAGAGSATLDEAVALGLDTLIVGEGPHWTAVDAPERGLVIMYAGHYATETLGVHALARELADRFDVPWTFIDAPTGM